MIKLHGFASSNYYNVPKLAMMEKGIEFEEVLAYTGFGPTYKPEYLDRTPLGKIPALETPEGFISESRAILDYIERANPQSPLLPDSAFGAAKVQELSQFIELYFELVARRLIPNLLMGTPRTQQLWRNSTPRSPRLPGHWRNFPASMCSPMAMHSPLRISQRF